LWLAMLPVIAADLGGPGLRSGSKLVLFGARLWRPTVVVTMLVFGVMLHYMTLGLPMVGYDQEMRLPVGWKELAVEVERIEEKVEKETGREPLVVGMDRYNIASQLAFYREDPTAMPGDPDEGVAHTMAGGHLFGNTSLMYEFWFPRSTLGGRTLILVSDDIDDVSRERTTVNFDRLDPVEEIVVRKNGIETGRYFVRVAYGLSETHVDPTTRDQP